MNINIGDTIFVPGVEAPAPPGRTIECPDCLGTKMWRVTLPSGEEFPVGCQRCADGWSSRGYVHAPAEWKPVVTEEKVTSLTLYKDALSVNHRDRVFTTREEAAEVAEAMLRDRKRNEVVEAAERLSNKLREVNRPHGRVSREDLRDVLIEAAHNNGLCVASDKDNGLPQIDREQAQRLYAALTGGKLPRRKEKAT